MIKRNVLELIGNTPLVRLENLEVKGGAKVYLKLENKNPGGSVKDRAALSMVTRAIQKGALAPGMEIMEPTSGNTGIAIAMIGSYLGYKVTLVMPETMSKERRDLIRAYGADLVLTEGALGMKGSIGYVNEKSAQDSNIFVPSQFDNADNPLQHYETTAVEIIDDLDRIDVFLAGVGTGGTITGVGKRLKQHDETIRIIAMEPANSPVLSGGSPGKHIIQGIGAGFEPSILIRDFIDEIVTVEDEQALQMQKELVRKEGLFLGISASANVFKALETAATMNEDQIVVTIAPDGGEKYISMIG